MTSGRWVRARSSPSCGLGAASITTFGRVETRCSMSRRLAGLSSTYSTEEPPAVARETPSLLEASAAFARVARASAVSAGSSIQNMLPSPGLLVKPIVPSMASTSIFGGGEGALGVAGLFV
jgi:hypothetical protein